MALTPTLLLDRMKLCDEGLCEGDNRRLDCLWSWWMCQNSFSSPLCLFRCVIVPVVSTGLPAMLVVPRTQSSPSVAHKHPLCVSGPEEFRDE